MKKFIVIGLSIALIAIGITKIKAQSQKSVEDEVKEKAAEMLYQDIQKRYVEESEMILGGEVREPEDVFGTTSGTSTVATAAGSFYTARKNNATTSKAIELNSLTDTALYTIRPLTASSSSFFDWKIFGSNDRHCATTSVSVTYGETVLASDISWYDADPSNSRTVGTLENMSDNATGTAVLLTDVAWRCLRFDAMGASTTIAVQLREKSN